MIRLAACFVVGASLSILGKAIGALAVYLNLVELYAVGNGVIAGGIQSIF